MADTVIANPTYIGDVRHFFEDVDLEHMFRRNIDFTTYPALRAIAGDVMDQVKPPEPSMPPDDRKWSQERVQSFQNWRDQGFQLGTVMMAQPGGPVTADRIRKDARALSEDEIATLRTAFQGIMDRDPDDLTSYFAIAGDHWYPNVHCNHHNDRYHPWHRGYVRRFEDALRSVPGCEQVTLPYWDITAQPPEFLFTAPFDAYTLPRDIHIDDMDPDASFPAGYRTRRNEAKEILDNVELRQIPQAITGALSMFDWFAFARSSNTGIERKCHDPGHVATGETMSTPDAAAFDPIFWFFHANWDRLWWTWQQAMQATTQWSFRSTVTTGDTEFLRHTDDNKLEGLGALSQWSDSYIDLAASGVAYGPVQTEQPVVPEEAPVLLGSGLAARGLRVRSGPDVSVRLKGINRLVIPGSFDAVLLADGEPIAREAFFQSTKPRECANCREMGVVDVTFRVPAEALTGRRISAVLELLAPGADKIGRRFPLSAAGNPTLNARLLLEEVPDR